LILLNKKHRQKGILINKLWGLKSFCHINSEKKLFSRKFLSSLMGRDGKKKLRIFVSIGGLRTKKEFVFEKNYAFF